MARCNSLALAVALVLGTAVPAGAAECNAEIQRVQSQLGNVSDGKVRRLVEYDIKRAKKEAAEVDGMECQEAIDHADKLLASPAPTP